MVTYGDTLGCWGNGDMELYGDVWEWGHWGGGDTWGKWGQSPIWGHLGNGDVGVVGAAGGIGDMELYGDGWGVGTLGWWQLRKVGTQ